MTSNGLFGIRINGVDKLSYNECDSYPTGLGEQIVNDLRWMKQDGLDIESLARNISFTDKDIDETIFHDSPLGRFGTTLKLGLMVDSGCFILDSLFCEWAYIVNFDDNTFEVYKGFQSKPHNNGRFANNEYTADGYYPCALIAVFPLDDIPIDWHYLCSLFVGGIYSSYTSSKNGSTYRSVDSVFRKV